MPGKRGPWLHWMMTDCKARASACARPLRVCPSDRCVSLRLKPAARAQGTTEGGFTTCDYMAPQPAIGARARAAICAADSTNAIVWLPDSRRGGFTPQATTATSLSCARAP